MNRLFIFLTLFKISVYATSTQPVRIPQKTSRWYVNWNLVDQNVLFAKTHKGMFSGFYPCCNKFTVLSNNTFSSEHTDEEVKASLNPYSALGLDVFPTLDLQEDYLNIYSTIPNGFDAVIKNATANTVRNNFDGYMVDYEPSNSTIAHAQAYAKFLSNLTASLHAQNKRIGVDLSNWGILDMYHLYAPIDIDIFTSMGTYSGSDIDANVKVVNQMVSVLNTSRISIGIGSMSTTPDANYNWTEYTLNVFLDFLQDSNITGVDIWRCDIDNAEETNTTLPWFLRVISDWFSS